MKAIKTRLIFWPTFLGFVVLALYTKRPGPQPDEALSYWLAGFSYAMFVAVATGGFIWTADKQKPHRGITLAIASAGLTASVVSTWSNNLFVPYCGGALVFLLGLVLLLLQNQKERRRGSRRGPIT